MLQYICKLRTAMISDGQISPMLLLKTIYWQHLNTFLKGPATGNLFSAFVQAFAG
jgi:hypothetical protein